jgi:hypothetical protein
MHLSADAFALSIALYFFACSKQKIEPYACSAGHLTHGEGFEAASRARSWTRFLSA